MSPQRGSTAFIQQIATGEVVKDREELWPGWGGLPCNFRRYRLSGAFQWNKSATRGHLARADCMPDVVLDVAANKPTEVSTVESVDIIPAFKIGDGFTVP